MTLSFGKEKTVEHYTRLGAFWVERLVRGVTRSFKGIQHAFLGDVSNHASRGSCFLTPRINMFFFIIILKIGVPGWVPPELLHACFIIHLVNSRGVARAVMDDVWMWVQFNE